MPHMCKNDLICYSVLYQPTTFQKFCDVWLTLKCKPKEVTCK